MIADSIRGAAHQSGLRTRNVAADITATAPRATVPILSASFICAVAYITVDYGRPQNWLPALTVIRPGLMVTVMGLFSLFRWGTWPKDRQSKQLLAFLGLLVASVPLAVNRNWAFWQAWSMLLLFSSCVFPLAQFVNSFERLKRLVRLWVVLHVSIAFYVLTHRGQGMGSFLEDENDVALALNIALPFAAALVSLERGWVRVGAAFATLLILVASTATMSRGGFIGLACVGVAAWLQSRRKVAALLAIGSLAAGAYALIPARYWDEISTISSADEKDDTGFQRLYSWNAGWKMFLDHPVIGVGPANYPHVVKQYEDATSDEIGYHLDGRVAHSIYFTLLPELGTVGTVLFMAILWRGFKDRRGLRRDYTDQQRVRSPSRDKDESDWYIQLSTCIDTAFIAFLVTGAFLSVLYVPHVWIITGFTMALVHSAATQQAQVVAGMQGSSTQHTRLVRGAHFGGQTPASIVSDRALKIAARHRS